MTLRDYARVASRRRVVILGALILTTFVAAALVALRTPIYQADAEVLVQPRGQDGLFDDRIVNLNQRAIQTEIQVIEGETVRDRVEQMLGMDDAPRVDAVEVQDTDVISVRVRNSNATNAQTLANTYANAYIDVRREQAVDALLAASTEVQRAIDDLQAQIEALPEGDARRTTLAAQLSNFTTTLDQLRVDAALRTGGAVVIKSAEMPTDPVEPTPVRTTLLAAVVGLLLGLGAAFLLDYLDTKIRSADDLERLTEVPVLSVVPVDPPPDHRPIAVSEPGHGTVEAYRGLRTNLQFLGLDRAIRIIQLTSSIAGEGKTTTSANLAVVLAQAGHRVALVDADLRRPRLHELFALPQMPGFTDLLLGGDVPPAVNKVALGDHELTVFTSGRVPSNPSEILSGRRVRQLLGEMASHYDYVIVDSAPILPVSDSVALSSAVDAVLVVAQAGRVTDANVGDTLERLERVSAPVLGLVLNQATNGRTDYTYGGYLPEPEKAAGSSRRERSAAKA